MSYRANLRDDVMMTLLQGYLEQSHGIRVRFKDQSRLMRFIGRVMFFNRLFMTHYTTTIGKTVYFPRGEDNWLTLAHEAVHALDYERRPVRFTLGYLMPQLLGVLGLLSLVGALWCTWSLLGAVLLLALAPWPSPWRLARERRGYQVTIAADILRERSTAMVRSPGYLRWLADHTYSGPSYYYMTWSRALAHALALADVEIGLQLVAGEHDDPIQNEVVGMLEQFLDVAESA